MKIKKIELIEREIVVEIDDMIIKFPVEIIKSKDDLLRELLNLGVKPINLGIIDDLKTLENIDI